MRILEIDSADWQRFVAGREDANPFHHPAWSSLLADCYGYRPFAVALVGADGIRRGLPLMEVRGLLGNRRWISLPFTDHCSPLAQTDELGALASAIVQASAAENVAQLEIRSPLETPALTRRAQAVVHRLPLDRDPEQVFAGFRSSVRRGIRKAEREGVEIREATSESDVAGAYYDLHLRTRKRQGTPVQPRRFFRLLWRQLLEPGLGYGLLAYVKGQPVAGAIFLDWNGTVIYKYGASNPRYQGLRPNNLLFWHAIRKASEQGRRTMDFGRTDFENEGLRAFKASWGATEEPLVYSGVGIAAPTGAGRARGLAGLAIRRSPTTVVCRAVGEAFYRYAA